MACRWDQGGATSASAGPAGSTPTMRHMGRTTRLDVGDGAMPWLDGRQQTRGRVLVQPRARWYANGLRRQMETWKDGESGHPAVGTLATGVARWHRRPHRVLTST